MFVEKNRALSKTRITPITPDASYKNEAQLLPHLFARELNRLRRPRRPRPIALQPPS
jgi:hypothetical protein